MLEIPSDHWLMNPVAGNRDAAILDLFRTWREQKDPPGGWPEDEDEHEAARDRLIATERQIAAMPACSPIGVSIKLFLLAHEILADAPRERPFPCALGELTEDDYTSAGQLCLDKRLIKGLLADAARQVPDLGPLSTAIMEAPETAAELVTTAGGSRSMVRHDAAPDEGLDRLSMRALHRRWAALEDDCQELEVLIGDASVASDISVKWGGLCLHSEAEIDAEAKRRKGSALFNADRVDAECAEAKQQLAEHRLIAARLTAAGGVDGIEHRLARLYADRERVFDGIAARPARTFRDLAMLFDVTLEESPEGPMLVTPEDGDLFDASWWDFNFARTLAALTPDFVFTYWRRRFSGCSLDRNGIPIDRAAPAN